MLQWWNIIDMSSVWERTATDGTRYFTDLVEYDNTKCFVPEEVANYAPNDHRGM
jgi:hypothetical protein